MYVYVCGILQNWSLYPHTLMYYHGTWTQWSLGRVYMWPQQTWGQRSSRGQWPLVQVFGKKGQCIHLLWCIFKSNILQWMQKNVIAKAGETRGSRTALLLKVGFPTFHFFFFFCFFTIFIHISHVFSRKINNLHGVKLSSGTFAF